MIHFKKILFSLLLVVTQFIFTSREITHIRATSTVSGQITITLRDSNNTSTDTVIPISTYSVLFQVMRMQYPNAIATPLVSEQAQEIQPSRAFLTPSTGFPSSLRPPVPLTRQFATSDQDNENNSENFSRASSPMSIVSDNESENGSRNNNCRHPQG